MDIPSLPTDNLYKFLAIAGVMLFGFSFAFPMVQIDELDLKYAVWRSDLDLMGLEIQIADESIKMAEGRKNLSSKEVLELKRNNQDNRRKLLQIKNKLRELDVIHQRIIFYRWFFVGGIILGAVMAFAGFGLWYYRIQRPLDIQLKKSRSI